MKAILGIDEMGNYRMGLHLFSRLGFDRAAVELLHVGKDSEPLTGAQSLCDELSVCVESSDLRSGSPAGRLLDHADQAGAQLIVIGCREAGRLGLFRYGRVSKSLGIAAKTSLLVAKGTVVAEGPVRAVVATDHSPYADRCIELLIDLRPHGIEHATVFTAYHPRLVEEGEFIQSWVEAEAPMMSQLRKRNDEVCRRLSSIIPHCDSRVVEADPNQGIDEAMTRSGADLLIMGAQGHGFLERLFVGSVALRQVASTTHSVLVLRAGGPE
jgi:nucleotide-binding universal stress UspA family protein